jgi:hypothetical protein
MSTAAPTPSVGVLAASCFVEHKTNFTDVKIVSVTGFDAVVVSAVSQTKFWTDFWARHSASTWEEAITLVIDLSRFHFSPKVTALPGAVVTVGYKDGGSDKTIVVTLEKGKTKLKSFEVGQGKTYSYTYGCLFSAGIFKEVFVANCSAEVGTIPGNHGGLTRNCGLLVGWTDADQDAAEGNFASWLALVGLPARDTNINKKVNKAAKATIKARTEGLIPAALSIAGINELLNGREANAAIHFVNK